MRYLPFFPAVPLLMTEEHPMKEPSRTNSERNDFILGATKTCLDVIDPQFNLRHVDSAWQGISGNPEGRKCHEYFKDLDSPCPGCGIPEALQTRSAVVTEEQLPKEGNRFIQVTTIPFQDEQGDWLDRPGLGIDAALKEIEQNRGLFYDKEVADACLKLFREKGFQLAAA